MENICTSFWDKTRHRLILCWRIWYVKGNAYHNHYVQNTCLSELCLYFISIDEIISISNNLSCTCTLWQLLWCDLSCYTIINYMKCRTQKRRVIVHQIVQRITNKLLWIRKYNISVNILPILNHNIISIPLFHPNL